MSRHTVRSFFARCVLNFVILGTIVLIAVPACSYAGGGFFASVDVKTNGVLPDTASPAFGCEVPNASTAATPATSATCNVSNSVPADGNGNVLLEGDGAAASFAQGGLHLDVSSTLINAGGGTVPFTPGYELKSGAYATATYTDSITLVSPPPLDPGYIDYTFNAIGNVREYYGSQDTSASFVSTVFVNGVTGCELDTNGNCTVRAPFNFSADPSFNIMASATGFASTAIGGCSQTSCKYGNASYAAVNFADTIFVSNLYFTDANGNRLLIDYTSASGINYSAVPAVPETGTVSWLICGLVLLGFCGIRRRQISSASHVL